MNKEILFSPDAPAPIGPYSQGVAAGELVFLSGQIPIQPETGSLVQGDIEEETRTVLENIQAVLRSKGLSLTHVVKTTIFLCSMEDFPSVNEVYSSFFPDSPPARSTVQVAALPKGARVEIEAVAVQPLNPGASS